MELQLGQIALCAFPFAQDYTLPCDGSLLSIAEWDELFNLFGTQFGGDGQSTFALPNLTLPAGLSAANASWQMAAYGAFPPYGGGDSYMGEIDLFAPGPLAFSGGGGAGYAPPQGQLLSIESYDVLFSLVQAAFGGNGATTFALPTLAPPAGRNTAGTALGYGICIFGAYPSKTSYSGITDWTIGTLELFALPWVPLGFLPCDGRAVNVADYAPLHSVIGNAFGGGSTTFNVPALTAPANMTWGIVTNGVMPSNVNET